jgi:PhnB protein
MAFHPYLNFGGNCREAFTRYQEIFGGEMEIMPFSDIPSDDPAATSMKALGDMVMHAYLDVDGSPLMASDDPSPEFSPAKATYVNYVAESV